MNTPSRIPDSADIKEAQAFENEKLDFSTSLNSILQFHPESFTLVLDVENVFIPEDLKFAALEYNLLQKTDVHITIIGSKIARQILKYMERLNESWTKVFLEMFHEIIHKYKFNITLLDKEFYYIEKWYDWEHRFAIIQIAQVENLDNLYKILGMLIWEHIQAPFPHVTFFTNSTNPEKKWRWIWIYSQKEFEDLNPIKCY